MSLSSEEKELLSIYVHFRVTSGNGLMEQNINVMLQELSPVVESKANDLLDSLIQKGYINYISQTNFYVLTDLGESELYGTFDINIGLSELMEMFAHFRVTQGTGLMLNNIQAYLANNNMSPLSEKHFDSILKHAIDNGFVIINANNFFILTEKGEKQIYS